jgi:multiple antibiotic resistance protein
MDELDNISFIKVLIKATWISFLIYIFFLFSGQFIFENIFNIDFEAFRIFGGIVIFSFAYLFIVNGKKAFIQMKTKLDDLASEIALPFMVGAGTISLTILLSYNFSKKIGVLLLIIILAINFLIIMFLKSLKDNIAKNRFKIAFDKNMDILLRLMGFFVGAIGINMIITGITNFFL